MKTQDIENFNKKYHSRKETNLMNMKKAVILLIVGFILCYPQMTKVTKGIEEVSESFRTILLQDETYYEEIKNVESLELEYAHCEVGDTIDVEFKIKSTFHFYKWGIVEVEYTKVCYNASGEVTYDIRGCPATLYIKKKNGKWIITKRYEPA
jgi:hypothetical protein